MDANFILQAITTVGFPIVAYGAMFWYVTQKDKNHSEEVTQLRQAVENNTLVVQQLLDSKKGV
jgi:hypothetical protein